MKLRDAWNKPLAIQIKDTKYPIMWQTQEGEVMLLEHMRTSHLFYSVRMLFNHTVPPEYQIAGCKRYDMSRIPKDVRKTGVRYLLEELATRETLPEWQQEQMRHMFEASRKLDQKGIINGPKRLPVR